MYRLPATLSCLLFLAVSSVFFNVAAAESSIVWRDVTDPSLREALFDSYQGRHFNAITQVLAAQKQGRITEQPERAALVLGGLYLGYGFHQEAVTLFQTFLQKDQPQPVQNQAWFYLAKTQYQRKRYHEALVALSRIKGKLDINLEPERRVMEGLMKMQLGDYSTAQALFNQVDRQSDWRAYAQYNLGVANYKSGNPQQGFNILSELGDQDSSNEEIQNLRDKANLVLGYGFLNDGKYSEAKRYLNRMYLTGRHSNTALLALGRVYSAEQDHKQSLVPWLELIKRDSSDPAVQDALMGVPFAFGQLNAYKQSLQYYETAMRAFQEEIDNINSAAEAINGGKLIEGLIRANNGELEGGGAFTVQRVLDTPEGRYLWPIVASDEFRETLYNYAELRKSLGKLEVWSASLGTYDVISKTRQAIIKGRISKLQSKVLLTAGKLEHHLQSMAYDELDRRKQRLVGYFNEARFAVAQIYDYAAKRWGGQ